MTFPALIDWLDDRLNPIVVKEVRQAVKSRLVVAILMLFLGLQLFLLGVFLVLREARGDMGADWTAGSEAFIIQQVILLWTISLIIPAYAAVRMLAERSDQNVDLMFSSTLSPGSIIWGKFFATLLLGMLVFSTCAPFMTFTYLLRGIDIPTILMALSMDLLVMLFNTMVALFFASLPGHLALKLLYCFLGFVLLTILTCFLTGISIALNQGIGFVDGVVEYWPVTLCFVAGVFALIGLFYSYAVAIISPPTSNRMFPVRLFLLGLVVVSLGGSLISTFVVDSDSQSAPIVMFQFVVMPILCLQIWISICEREHLGPRVRRAIPRNVLARIPAFLLYTGSAGGILFSALLIAGSLGLCLVWLKIMAITIPTMVGRSEDVGEFAILIHGLMALYVYCYGQTAVLVRRYMLSDQIRPGFTWVVAGLLVGLGTALPPMFAYFIFNDQMRHSNDVAWWLIPNPFVSYIDLIWDGSRRGFRHQEFDLMCLWFLLTWSALVTVLSVPWFVEQIRAFHPPRPKPDAGNEELAALILLEADPEPEPKMGVQA